MSVITYNKLLDIFEQIKNEHIQIKRFGSGAIEDVNTFTPDSGEFPIMWIIPQEASFGENSLTYSIRLLIFDADETDDSLTDAIYSDTLLIINDVIQMLKQGSEEYSVINDVRAIPFNQRFIDYCVGWYCDIDIEVEMFNGNYTCFVPLI